ncbi:hypothetical protein AMECASPLE_020926 [Ameca splendens]|uniref:LRRCT domain-containing protein n=1 Tax=Ameca splendens TaxID=208324 RepID=A0ABV0XGF6_9TELE
MCCGLPGSNCALRSVRTLWSIEHLRGVLDLSDNRIGCLSPEMFLDLGRLSKLNLSGNIFSTLSTGLFTNLQDLRILTFGTETLFCDCQLKWLLRWAQQNSVRVGNDTVCVFPTHLHGLEFRNLREQQLKCGKALFFITV